MTTSLFSSFFWDRTASNPVSEASVYTINSLLKSGYYKIGAVINHFFSCLKAVCCLVVQLKGVSFFNNNVIGLAIREKSFINFR